MKKKYFVSLFILLLLFLSISYISDQKFIHNKFYRSITKLIPLEIKKKIINSKTVETYYTYLISKKTLNAFNLSKKDMANKRKIFKEEFLLDESQVSITLNKKNKFKFLDFKYKPSAPLDIYSANYYEIEEYGILEYANVPKNKLLIYNQGHRGNPYNFKNFINIKNHYKKKGFDVLALSMPNLGFNKKVNFPGKDQNLGKHEIYHSFYDEKYKQKKPISVFVSGSYYLIKNLIERNDYEKIYYVGISGGGWMVTFLSSFITDIDESYSFASLIPLELKLLGVRGDWEASKAEFYKKIDYYDLFNLATLDKNFERKRKHFLVYNKDDDCCFSRPWSKIMKNVGENLGSQNFIIDELDINKHTIDLKYLFNKF